MYRIVVPPEPNDSRPLYGWRVAGTRLIATGIARTEDDAWPEPQPAVEARAA